MQLRSLLLCQQPQTVALVERVCRELGVELDAVFGAGTHLVIYKPLTHDRLRNGLRAIRALMGRRQQRGSRRVKADIVATITVDETENIPAKILDISGGGAALSIQRSLPAVKSLKLSFVLPGGKSPITTAAELVWKDVQGRLGIQFVNISPTSTLMISKWMKAHPAANRIAPSS